MNKMKKPKKAKAEKQHTNHLFFLSIYNNDQKERIKSSKNKHYTEAKEITEIKCD